MEEKIEETEDTLWGFRVGDIITDKNPSSEWHQKRVTVTRIGKAGGTGDNVLWGQPEEEGFESCRYADSPKGLVLLERADDEK